VGKKSILQEIASYKREEIKIQQREWPISVLERKSAFSNATFSLKNKLLKQRSPQVIAEFKRRSPSKGFFKREYDLKKILSNYQDSGAVAISILTDTNFFSGSLDDLTLARRSVALPLLRKDFVVDDYQIYQAKAFGADMILLIAAILSKEEIIKFSKIAKSLALEVLLEIHSRQELEQSLTSEVDFVGVNSRNLNDFSLDLELFYKLGELIPKDFIKIAESGIDSPQLIKTLSGAGYSAFLIGEHFMRQEDSGEACKKFIASIK
jgi:indole-3-glycerol phosphate synthase